MMIHQRINWPDGFDMQNLFMAIFYNSFMRFDLAGLPIHKIKSRYHLRLHALGKYAIRSWRAALWYAVMKTAIETYGLKESE